MTWLLLMLTKKEVKKQDGRILDSSRDLSNGAQGKRTLLIRSTIYLSEPRGVFNFQVFFFLTTG